MARHFFAFTSLALLLGGCSTLESLSGSDNQPDTEQVADREMLDSQQQTLAAGDDNLQRAVSSPGADPNTELDDAIAPALKDTATSARKRLDDVSDSDTEAAESAAPEEDMWMRLRRGFAMDHNAGDERVEQHLRWFVKHPHYIDRVVERGRRYLYHIVSETESRGMPLELALLPIVESAFDPFAYSHGRAAGLWQFVPATGRHFGLSQSWWHDERRDVLAATDAALTYLESLSQRFDNDYMLALAGYNSGGGTVNSAIRRNTRKNLPTDYWSLDLPRETRQYVPKLIALARIIDDPQTYGIELPPLADEPYFEVVDTGSQIDLAQAAELAGIDVDEIYLLNPSYNRWATSPDGPHRLLVPVASADRFRERLAAIDADQRVSWRDYTVSSGDSLSVIANKFDTTASVIKKVNNMRGDLIRAGQQLLIPVSSGGSADYALSENQRLARTQERGGKSGDGRRTEHTVQRGDTFWDIARDHGVSVRQVAAWNGMAPGDPLIPGRELVIWSKTASQPTQARANSRDGMVRKVGYRVRKGDSLAAIASRFSVNVRDIATWNDINISRYLQPGQSLVLYVDVRNSP